MSDLQICYTPRGLSTLNPSEKKMTTSQQCSGADETQAGFKERTSDLPCPPMLVACSRAETHSCWARIQSWLESSRQKQTPLRSHETGPQCSTRVRNCSTQLWWRHEWPCYPRQQAVSQMEGYRQHMDAGIRRPWAHSWSTGARRPAW